MRGTIGFALGTLAACSSPSPKWEPYRGKLPTEVVLPHEGLESFGWRLALDREVHAWFHLIPWERGVDVYWERGDDGGSSDYPTDYVPTTLLPADRRSLLVAGKRDDGRTVIELWTFDSSVVPPARSSRTVYDQAREGRDMVLLLIRVPGSDRTCLVQFWDSRDVYELEYDASPGVLELLASPEPERGALTVPPLRRLFDTVWSGDHLDRGLVYHLGSTYLYDPPGPPPSVVLIDADRDGRLDRFETVDPEEWAESGWGDGSSYRRSEE